MKRVRGFTLIELVIAIVILSMITVTMVGLLAFISRTSAESLTSTQSAIIANAYLQEILRQEFSGASDDIDAFNGRVDTGARDGSNNLIPGLENYRVQIAVQHLSFGPGTNNVPASATRLVTITVTDPMGEWVRLSGLRTRR
jgi:prepilin-type N-terminal cleavage/methylation domain-containing protein